MIAHIEPSDVATNQTLAELVASGRYQTDKETVCAKQGHSYVRNFYEKEFAPYRTKTVELLELGVQYGGSIKLWHDYFHMAWRLVGVDIDLRQTDKEVLALKDADRIEFIEHNAYDKEFADSLGEFDIIIDDGPHTLESQVAATVLYLPHVKPGGLFIIEDVPCYGYSAILDTYLPPGLTGKMYDFTSSGRADDIMYVVRK